MCLKGGTLEPTVLLRVGDVLAICWEEGSAPGGCGIAGVWCKRLGNWGARSAWCPCKHGM